MRIKIKNVGELENFSRHFDKIKEVKLQTRPSLKDFKDLQEKLPNLEKVVVAPSIYRILAKSINDAGINIAIEASSDPRGRPRKYDTKSIKQILDHWNAGRRVPEISKLTGMPERTVYYYLKKHGLVKRKRYI